MREWRHSGDEAFLRRIWPACKKALEFAWLPGSWDADQDGVAEGSLHNTMDVEYFGPTAIIQGWYLGALGAAAEMATAIGDAGFASLCAELQDRGAAWTEAHLFNGSYYAQDVRPPASFDDLRPEVRHPSLGAQDVSDPEFQVGGGCLVDQLAGDVAARFAGLPSPFDPEHVATALDSIHRFNHVGRLGSWTNFMRTFGANEDEGHVMLAYPAGLPPHPMPYWSEVMTGFEYTYALGLALTGRAGFAEEVVGMVRRRYDGYRRNPYDEAECGHHYARAMASWGLVHALAGIDYDGRDKTLRLRADGLEGRWFWAVNGAWGAPGPPERGQERIYDLENQGVLRRLAAGPGHGGRRGAPPFPSWPPGGRLDSRGDIRQVIAHFPPSYGAIRPVSASSAYSSSGTLVPR